MRKLFTIALLVLAGTISAWAQADNTFRFVDKDGKEVPDGTVLTITETEDDGWGGVMMKTGLYIKSSQSGTVYGSMAYTIDEIDNGAFQVCFPENCTSQERVGEYETPAGEVKTEDIQAEWIPDGYGTARVTLQPKTYKYNAVTKKYTFVGDGPKVTIHFTYSDPAGVPGTAADGKKEVGRYTMDGRKMAHPQKGINIVKTDDGKAHKVLVK